MNLRCEHFRIVQTWLLWVKKKEVICGTAKLNQEHMATDGLTTVNSSEGVLLWNESGGQLRYVS